MTEINKASQQSLQRILDKLGVKSTEDKKVAENKSTLGQEDFLKLMTTQLQNQDPFAPMENGDFIAQMAQFSTVTGITDMGNQMKALNDKLDGFRIATASQYLGHSVLVPGSVVRPNGNDNIEGVIDVPNATTKLQVFFQKENGEIIEQLDLGGQSRGLVGFSWENIPDDIKKNNQKIFISAFLGDNPDQALSTSVFSKVLGTSTENNEIKLDVDGYGLIDASKAVRFRN
ncbi:MAG: Basal-body rod modification protein FlgD [Alphaproteobacteria bacterium MarineAlpha9_Bin4]|nr:flagellar biosynthesis protein FlgJ [Pelagibacterales bacterium]PPR25816.1 MAG: Basal-body rod modification protein FlgD [Alphaproteobacteria bacterium MarineAlpha9_Bin4]|tara:strand:- start:1294 stop:1983 length:690 start_codon:yes stop_codon:yes gene_type:complete